MQVSDWWMFVSFYQNVLAVPLAIVALVLLVRAKTPRRRGLYGALIPLALMPNIQVFVGNLYFDYLCRTQAGEFIYRTVDNVEGILQMRPRDGSKDYFDRMRAGDIPEDPWGHTNAEATRYRPLYVGPPGSGRYSFIESKIYGSSRTQDVKYERYSVRVSNERTESKSVSVQPVRDITAIPTSSFGYTWDEISSPFALALNIHVGRIRVVALQGEVTLAEKIGLLRTKPWQVCPQDKSEEFVFNFVTRVLKPAG